MSTPPRGRLVSQFANDPEMAELVELFLNELPSRVEALNVAWTSHQVTNLSRLTHQLKGASAGYGFPTIGEAAGKLEGKLRQLGTTQSEAALKGLAGEFKALVELCAQATTGK